MQLCRRRFYAVSVSMAICYGVARWGPDASHDGSPGFPCRLQSGSGSGHRN